MKYCEEQPESLILAYAHDYTHGDVEPTHAHQCAQFLHSLSGVIRIQTQTGSWVLPANKGMWLPAGLSHRLQITGNVKVRTLFVDPLARADLPGHCLLSDVSPLLKSLIVEAVTITDTYLPGTREERIFELILDELRRLKAVDFYLPSASSELLIGFCDYLSQRISHPWTAADAAKYLGLSERTVSRKFQQEMNLTFTEWLRQKRLLCSLEYLAEGHSVLETAVAIGYESPSAFSAMFKSRIGISPSDYFPSIAEGRHPR